MTLNIFIKNIIKIFLSLDFPNKSQMIKQIETSSMRVVFQQTLITVHLEGCSELLKLPSWMNGRSTSFYITVPSKPTPVVFDLYIKNGFIAEFELYYFDYSRIEFDEIIKGTVQAVCCYDTDKIINLLNGKRVEINSFVISGNSVDLYIKSLGKETSLNNRIVFRNCKDIFVTAVRLPQEVESISITKTNEDTRFFSVTARHAGRATSFLSFECESFYTIL